MAANVVASDFRTDAAIVSARLQDIFAGAICGFLSSAYCLSYAALIFSGPLSQWLGYGIAVTFLSAAIGGLVVTLRSSQYFTIAGPESSTIRRHWRHSLSGSSIGSSRKARRRMS